MDPTRTARLRCSTCGEVEVALLCVEVHVNAREDVALFVFPCPGCGELASGGDRRTLAALLRDGAARYELRSTAPPAIRHDDLLRFHEWLDGDEPWPAPPAAWDPGA
jgi:hypothetical protein